MAKKTKARRAPARAREPGGGGSSEDGASEKKPSRIAPEARDPEPPRPARAQPPSTWWLLGAITAVIVVVAFVRMRQQDESASASGVPDAGGEPAARDHDRARDHDHAGGGAGSHAEEPAVDRDAPPERLAVHVLRSFPHDPGSFTQGLLWYDGHLFESAGLYRRSSLREVDLESGRVLERREVEPRIFAEGLARVDSRLYQISWQEGVAQVWSLPDLEPVRRFDYQGEGWGLCFDGEHLVMSDGSSRLFFRDPETFRVVRSVEVRAAGEPIDQLNELECVDGVVWSNVWQTDRILRIDPRSGRVTGEVDASDLLRADERADADVLNGIAWIPERGHFVITGKLWPRLFEVDFVPAPVPAGP